MKSPESHTDWERYAAELEAKAEQAQAEKGEDPHALRERSALEDKREANLAEDEKLFGRSEEALAKLKRSPAELAELEHEVDAQTAQTLNQLIASHGLSPHLTLWGAMEWIHDRLPRYNAGSPEYEALDGLRQVLEALLAAGDISEKSEVASFLKYLEQKSFSFSRFQVERELSKVWGDPELMLRHNRVRLTVMNLNSRVFKDSVAIKNGCKNILAAVAAAGGVRFTPDEAKSLEQAALLHDLGKTGPETASHRQQQAVTDLFAIDNIGGNPEQVSVREVLKAHFDESGWRERLRDLEGIGVMPDWSMRQFYDAHSQWSYDNLLQHDEGELVGKLVAAHHAYRENNFYGDADWDKKFGPDQIVDSPDIREILLARTLMIIDVLQAYWQRGMQGTGKKLDTDEIFRQIELKLQDKFGQDALCRVILSQLKQVNLEPLFAERSETEPALLPRAA